MHKTPCILGLFDTFLVRRNQEKQTIAQTIALSIILYRPLLESSQELLQRGLQVTPNTLHDVVNCKHNSDFLKIFQLDFR